MKKIQNIGLSEALVANRKSTTISVAQLFITAKLSFVVVRFLLVHLTYREELPVNLTSTFCVAVDILLYTSKICPAGRINESHCTNIFQALVIFAVVFPSDVIISCV